MQICDALGVGRGITSVIGAGGKSTLLQVLVQELSGSRVLTTTTRMLPIAGIELLLDPSEEALRHALAARGAVCVGSPTSEAFGGVTKLAAPDLPLQTIARGPRARRSRRKPKDDPDPGGLGTRKAGG